MTKAERAKAELAKFTAGMPPEMAAALAASFDAESAKSGALPLAALRTAVTAFRSTHQRTGDAWAKRDAAVSPAETRGVERWSYNVLAGDIDGDGDRDFQCLSCMAVQPECACALCGEAGPGRCCITCGAGLAWECPACNKPWIPLLLEEEEEGAAMRLTEAVIAERTTAKTEGRVRLLVNTSKPDDYNSILPPTLIANRITPSDLAFDIDHQICRCKGNPKPCEIHGGDIDGVRCEAVSVAKVPWRARNAAPDAKPEILEATVMDVTFDLTKRRAKMLYDGIPERWPAASVEFVYPKHIDDAVMANRNSGKPFVITEIKRVKKVTFTAMPSNDAALVTEIRTSRQMREATRVKAEDAQQLIAQGAGATIGDALRQAVDSIGTGSGSPSPTPAGESSAPPAPAGGGAPELSLQALSDKLEAQTQNAESTRTTLSKQFEAGLAELRSQVVALREELKTATETVTSQRTQIEDQNKTIESIRTNAAEGITRLHTAIQRLTAVPKRVGSSGAESGDPLSEALRSIPENERQKSPAEKAYDAKQAEALERARLSTPI